MKKKQFLITLILLIIATITIVTIIKNLYKNLLLSSPADQSSSYTYAIAWGLPGNYNDDFICQIDLKNDQIIKKIKLPLLYATLSLSPQGKLILTRPFRDAGIVGKSVGILNPENDAFKRLFKTSGSIPMDVMPFENKLIVPIQGGGIKMRPLHNTSGLEFYHKTLLGYSLQKKLIFQKDQNFISTCYKLTPDKKHLFAITYALVPGENQCAGILYKINPQTAKIIASKDTADLFGTSYGLAATDTKIYISGLSDSPGPKRKPGEYVFVFDRDSLEYITKIKVAQYPQELQYVAHLNRLYVEHRNISPQQIEVIDCTTDKIITKIGSIHNSIAFNYVGNDKIYVTSNGEKKSSELPQGLPPAIEVIDLKTNQVSKRITGNFGSIAVNFHLK